MGNVFQTDYITKAVLDIDTLVWEQTDRVPYNGPWERLDRAAQNAAKQAANTARDTAAQSGASATNERSALTPFYRSEMTAQHGFNPGQLNELLNFAGSGAAGAGATGQGQIESEAARTRNTAGFTPALRQNALDRMKTGANANLAVGAQDVMGAKELNQQGAAGMRGLFDTDTATMLKAMGQQNEDIGTQVEAGKSGWLQNTMGMLNTLGGLGSGIGAMRKR